MYLKLAKGCERARERHSSDERAQKNCPFVYAAQRVDGKRGIVHHVRGHRHADSCQADKTVESGDELRQVGDRHSLGYSEASSATKTYNEVTSMYVTINISIKI